MNGVINMLSSVALSCAVSVAAAQQQTSPPATAPTPARPAGTTPKATAQSEAGEPRVNTSTAPAAAPDRVSEGGEPRNTSASAPGDSPAAPRSPAGKSGAPGAAQKQASKTDRLELGTATVTGSQEQPKVMYVVPWKRSDIGDLAGKPMNSLVDEILAPVDRDVFKREVVYYHAVQGEASQNGAPPTPAQQGEK